MKPDQVLSPSWTKPFLIGWGQRCFLLLLNPSLELYYLPALLHCVFVSFSPILDYLLLNRGIAYCVCFHPLKRLVNKISRSKWNFYNTSQIFHLFMYLIVLFHLLSKTESTWMVRRDVETEKCWVTDNNKKCHKNSKNSFDC